MEEDDEYKNCTPIKINLGEERRHFKKDLKVFHGITRPMLQKDRDISLKGHQVTLYDVRVDGNEDFKNCVIRYFMRKDDLYSIAVSKSIDDGVSFTVPYEMYDEERKDGKHVKLVLKGSQAIGFGCGYDPNNWEAYNGMNYQMILDAYRNVINNLGDTSLDLVRLKELEFSTHLIVQLVAESARNRLVAQIYDNVLNHSLVIMDMMAKLVKPFFWKWRTYSREARKFGSRNKLTANWEEFLRTGQIPNFPYEPAEDVKNLSAEEKEKLYNYRILCNRMLTMKHQQPCDFQGGTYKFFYHDKELKNRSKKEED